MQSLALRSGHPQLAPEHLFKVLLDDEKGLAANLIQAAGGDAKAALAQAKADIASAKASVQTARINLDNTVIKAPISGRIEASTLNVGALVTASQSAPLTIIRQLDPINVDVTQSSTRKEELLLTEKELNRVWILRKLLNQMPVIEAMEFLQERMGHSETNEDFLASMNEPVL